MVTKRRFSDTQLAYGSRCAPIGARFGGQGSVARSFADHSKAKIDSEGGPFLRFSQKWGLFLEARFGSKLVPNAIRMYINQVIY